MSENQPYEWSRYFDAVQGLPPRDTLLKAIDLHESAERAAQIILPPGHRPIAADLGCGDGRDTLELLRRGWRVIAVDSSPDAIHRLMDKAPIDQMDRLEPRTQRFEDAKLPPIDLVNASFALPHCDPADFDDLWEAITRPIVPGGRFAGQLFGIRDEWAKKNPDNLTRTFHARADVERLLDRARLVPELLEEIERPGKNAFGEPKHWHVFHIVARRVP
ncbi:MAG: class I SAM-dependent methyltransferase [Phycisphaerales bacterium]|nr:class I SAM-dependent methyltransferase [Phycisphaerales bacterium]